MPARLALRADTAVGEGRDATGVAASGLGVIGPQCGVSFGFPVLLGHPGDEWSLQVAPGLFGGI